MAKKLTFVFPGGGGGNWLQHLIYCLQNNETSLIVDNVNYHNKNIKKSQDICITHDVNDKSNIFFNSKAVFNIYLNVVKKLRYSDQKIHLIGITEKFETLASEASSKLFFLEEQIDLNWDYIHQDSSLFIEQLFDILDNHNIVYQKNFKICQNAINNYKKTCVDPDLYFNNFDSEEWLGWCTGISKHLWQDWPLVTDLDQIRKFLEPKKDFYRDFTRPYTINIK